MLLAWFRGFFSLLLLPISGCLRKGKSIFFAKKGKGRGGKRCRNSANISFLSNLRSEEEEEEKEPGCPVNLRQGKREEKRGILSPPPPHEIELFICESVEVFAVGESEHVCCGMVFSSVIYWPNTWVFRMRSFFRAREFRCCSNARKKLGKLKGTNFGRLKFLLKSSTTPCSSLVSHKTFLPALINRIRGGIIILSLHTLYFPKKVLFLALEKSKNRPDLNSSAGKNKEWKKLKFQNFFEKKRQGKAHRNPMGPRIVGWERIVGDKKALLLL